MSNGKGSKSRITNKSQFDRNYDEISWENNKNIPSNNMTLKHKPSPYNEKMYDFSMQGKMAKIRLGASEYLMTMGWAKGVHKNYDSQLGEIKFEYGKNTPFHHYCVVFDDGCEIGFPPESVEIISEID